MTYYWMFDKSDDRQHAMAKLLRDYAPAGLDAALARHMANKDCSPPARPCRMGAISRHHPE